MSLKKLVQGFKSSDASENRTVPFAWRTELKPTTCIQAIYLHNQNYV